MNMVTIAQKRQILTFCFICASSNLKIQYLSCSVRL